MTEIQDSGRDNEEQHEEGLTDVSNILEQRRELVIQERWLLTHVLTVHLEIENTLIALLKYYIPKHEKLFSDEYRSLTFAQTVSLCEGLEIIDEDVAAAIRQLNKLRNNYGHVANYRPDLKMATNFLGAIDKVFPAYRANDDDEDGFSLISPNERKQELSTLTPDQIEHSLFTSIVFLGVRVASILESKQID
jgi:hypothetical protein